MFTVIKERNMDLNSKRDKTEIPECKKSAREWQKKKKEINLEKTKINSPKMESIGNMPEVIHPFPLTTCRQMQDKMIMLIET